MDGKKRGFAQQKFWGTQLKGLPFVCKMRAETGFAELQRFGEDNGGGEQVFSMCGVVSGLRTAEACERARFCRKSPTVHTHTHTHTESRFLGCGNESMSQISTMNAR